MSRWTFRVLVVVPAAHQAVANAAWKQHVDQTGGENAFSSGVTRGNSQVATHMACHSVLRRESLPGLRSVLDSVPQASAFVDGDDNDHARDVLGNKATIGPFSASGRLSAMNLVGVRDASWWHKQGQPRRRLV